MVLKYKVLASYTYLKRKIIILVHVNVFPPSTRGRTLAGIPDSNHAGGMDVCLL